VLWLWVLGGLLAWLVLAVLVAVVIGRGIRLADRHAAGSVPLTVEELVSVAPAARTRAVGVRTRRRSIPLPPVGVGLAALAVGLETIGYVTRLAGQGRDTTRLLSMDAPFSVPRLFVALMFAAAAFAAVSGAGAGAGSLPGRRTWWLAVGLVGGGISAVKAGSTVHADTLVWLQGAVGDGAALAISAAAAALVVGVLWFLSRTERRDRRRVLGVLGLYAVAAVGLSALSSVVSAADGGGTWAATATFVEESGEALAGVAFLMAVLVGVAPQLVLPADWVLRRRMDAEGLVVPQPLVGPPGAQHPTRG
jgi:hypothetical protein